MLLGQHGVSIFFVLSGYLITTKLLTERQASGRIRLSRFYTSRFFRLMPCAWAYLFALILIGLVAHVQIVSRGNLLSCILFYRNYWHMQNVFLTLHFWSLSMEEQFYLIWPLILSWMGSRYSKWFCVAAIAGIGIYRLDHWGSYLPDPNYFRSEVRADAILAGCALALFCESPAFNRFLKQAPKALLLIGSVVVSWCVATKQGLIPSVEVITLSLLIGILSKRPIGLAASILESKPLVFVGRLSYSIYVWQQMFARLFQAHQISRIEALLLITGSALASYYLLEQPARRLGARLIRRNTGGDLLGSAEPIPA
jgi:peptidoglycan/LPS O-acetylase OafA/YrhL